MKQGYSGVIGLLTFLLLATFGAAAYFVGKAYSSQKAHSVAVELAKQQERKMVELEKVVDRLEAEWQVAATESENAMAQLEQFRGLIEDQDKEIEYLLGNLQTMSNQLNAAIAVENNLNQRILQLDKEKRNAIQSAEGLSDKLSALEKEFEAVKIRKPTIPPHETPLPAAAEDKQQERIKGLGLLKKDRDILRSPNPSSPKPTEVIAVSGTVREVNAEFGFVILDLGVSNGVKPGDMFSVSRAKKPVGRLRVRKLHSGLSVCDIIGEETSMAILRGDQVQQLK
jgi:hypothetical protein